MNKIWAVLGGLCAFLLGMAAPKAGVILTLERSMGKEKVLATVYLEGDKIRVEDAGQRGTIVMIFDGAQKKMVMLRPDKKSYAEMSEETLKKMRGQIDQMRAQMQERLKTLPPDQRKKMEAMMAEQGMGPETKPDKDLQFQALGQKKTINGFACELYKVSEDGKSKEENCIAPWSDKVLQRTDLTGLEKMRQFFQGALGSAKRGGIWQISKYPGFPVTRSKTGADGQKELEELKSVKRMQVAADKFTVPAGYKKEALPQMK